VILGGCIHTTVPVKKIYIFFLCWNRVSYDIILNTHSILKWDFLTNLTGKKIWIWPAFYPPRNAVLWCVHGVPASGTCRDATSSGYFDVQYSHHERNLKKKEKYWVTVGVCGESLIIYEALRNEYIFISDNCGSTVWLSRKCECAWTYLNHETRKKH
jgi:hypothetical protein